MSLPISLTEREAELCRQWFDSVQDTNSVYLTPEDYVVAAKLYEAAGMRVPHSIAKMLP